jgi:hypothetical protein
MAPHLQVNSPIRSGREGLGGGGAAAGAGGALFRPAFPGAGTAGAGGGAFSLSTR